MQLRKTKKSARGENRTRDSKPLFFGNVCSSRKEHKLKPTQSGRQVCARWFHLERGFGLHSSAIQLICAHLQEHALQKQLMGRVHDQQSSGRQDFAPSTRLAILLVPLSAPRCNATQSFSLSVSHAKRHSGTNNDASERGTSTQQTNPFTQILSVSGRATAANERTSRCI